MLRHVLVLLCAVAALAAASRESGGHHGGGHKKRPPPPMMPRPIGRVSVFYHCMCERSANETDGGPPDAGEQAKLVRYVRRQVEQHGHEHPSLEDMLAHFGLDCEQCAASHIGGGVRVPLIPPHPPHPRPPKQGDESDSGSDEDDGDDAARGRGHGGGRKKKPHPPPMRMPRPTVSMNFGCRCSNSSAPMPPAAPTKRQDEGGHKHSAEHRHDLDHLMEHLGLECDCAKIAVMGHIDMPIMAKPKRGRPPPPA